MWRTTTVTLAVCMMAYLAGAWLTMDFRIWTAEGARRLAVVQSPVAAPEVSVHGPGLDASPMPALLSAGAGATIMDFIYTRCVTVCSQLGGTFSRLQAAMQADSGHRGARVQLLSVSFDLTHDRAEVLKAYGAGLHADPRIWWFVVPTQAAGLHALLERYGVVVIPDGLGGYAHNAALLVLDRSGRLIQIYDYERYGDALALARQLAAKR